MAHHRPLKTLIEVQPPVKERIGKIGKLLFPPSPNRAPSTQDLVAAWTRKNESERSTVRFCVPYLPVLALAFVLLNVLVQTGGDASRTMAIASNIKPSLFAVYVFLSLLNLLAAGVLVVAPRFISDHTYPVETRRFFRLLMIITIILYAYALSLLFAALYLVLAYLLWRFLGDRKEAPKRLSFDSWVINNTPPTDTVLHNLWSQARELRSSDPAVARHRATAPGHRSELTLAEISTQVMDRQSAIDRASTPGLQNALYRFSGVIFSTYGLLALTSPIHLGPEEIVNLENGKSESGYVLISDNGQGVVFDSDERTVKAIATDDIKDRLICTRIPGWYELNLSNLSQLSSSGRRQESCS